MIQRATNSAFTGALSTHYFNVYPAYSGDVTHTPTTNLVPSQLYYWRVASVCGETDVVGGYSAPFTFRAAPAGAAFAPPPPMIAPADGVTTGSIRVTFLYSPVAAADLYALLVYSSLEAAQGGSGGTSYTTTGTSVVTVFNPETTRYWRVKSRNSYGWGELSGIRMLNTPTLTAAATISPEAGGTLSPTAGFLTVNFPPGAVSSPTQLNFRLLAAPQHPMRSYLFANRAFTLDAVAGGQPVTQFAKPYTMLLTYDPNDLAAAGIADPLQLNLLFWDGETWQRALPCAGCRDRSRRAVRSRSC